MNPADQTLQATTSAPNTAVPMAPFGTDVFALMGNLFSDSGLFSFVAAGGILAVLGTLWSIFALISYIVSIGLLALYVYGSIQKNHYADLMDQSLRDEERLYGEHYRGKARSNHFANIQRHVDSGNPNDWKLAIIEADVMLDELLKQRGYAGNSLGERLRSISPQQLETLNDAWEAHKVRNRIAHEGQDFVLTQRIAQETVTRYQRVFAEFGVY